MNYNSPQQRKDLRWDYTTQNDGVIYPIGYCRVFKEWTPEIIAQVFGTGQEGVDRYESYIAPFRLANEQGLFHGDGHESKEEAYSCYKKFVLDFALTFHERIAQINTLHKCQIDDCPHFIYSGAMVNNSGWPEYFYLCEDHLTRESVEKLFSVGDSFQS